MRAGRRSTRAATSRSRSERTAYVFNGATERWIADGAVGSLVNPSWGQFDLRVQYKHRMMGLGTEVFVDIFNVFDGQGSIRNQDLVAGTGGIAFGAAASLPGAAAPLLPRGAPELLDELCATRI